jgi:hypothetical protein
VRETRFGRPGIVAGFQTPFRAKRLTPTGRRASQHAGLVCRLVVSPSGQLQDIGVADCCVSLPARNRCRFPRHFEPRGLPPTGRCASQHAGWVGLSAGGVAQRVAPGHRCSGLLRFVARQESLQVSTRHFEPRGSPPQGDVRASTPAAGWVGLSAGGIAQRVTPGHRCSGLFRRVARQELSQVSRRRFEPRGLPPQGDLRASTRAGLVCLFVVSVGG